MRPKQVFHLKVRVKLGVMLMKGYSILSRAQKLELNHLMQLMSYTKYIFLCVYMCVGFYLILWEYVMFWPFDQAKNAIQGDALEESDTFQWPVIERDRMGGLRLIIWDKVKVPLCQYRLMHRKRVTSELHDSYFRLMTIKHSISKIQWAIVWALNNYLTQLSSDARAVASRIPDS